MHIMQHAKLFFAAIAPLYLTMCIGQMVFRSVDIYVSNVEYNAWNTVQRMYKIQFIEFNWIEYNAYNTMHSKQCIEYNA